MSTHETRSTSADPKHFGDNFIPIIPVDYLEHITAHPFCWDRTCPCHDDYDAVEKVIAAFNDGLCTSRETYRICAGQQVGTGGTAR